MFDSQVDAINRVQRTPGSWSVASFYRIRRRKPDWSGVPMFPHKDELRVAEVRFRVDGAAYRAVLSMVEGHIFDLSITPSPKRIAFAEWDSDPEEVNLLANPLLPPTPTDPNEPLPPRWEMFLATGRAAGDWTLHDRNSAYRVTLDDGEYLVLAERRGEEFLLHRLEPFVDEFFLHELSGRSTRPIDGELGDTLGEGRREPGR